MDNNNLEKFDESFLIKEYINQLTEDEKIVMEIAQKQLQTSFSIEKSIGFIEWKKIKFSK